MFKFNPTTSQLDLVGSLDGALLATGAVTGATSQSQLFTNSVLVGIDANLTDFPAAKLVSSKNNTGHTHTGNIGILGEANAPIGDTGTGVGGVAKTNGANQGRGVAGVGKVAATGDGGASIGGYFRAEDTHAGGRNIGVYTFATGGASNNALYLAGGDIYTPQQQNWTLYDNYANSLRFNSTGKADILNIDTTDGAERVTMSGNLAVTGAISGSNLIGINTGDTTFNVKTYGAKGDDTTDDTTSIQNAINAAFAANGGTVFFPAGTYKISSALTAKDSVSLVGSGTAATIIHQVTTSVNGITGTDLQFMEFKSLTVKGPTTGTGKGIALLNSAHQTQGITMDQIIVQLFGSHGIEIQKPIINNLTGVDVINCGGDGFYLHGDDGAAPGTSTTLNNCYANTNGGIGHHLKKMIYTGLNGCAADGCAQGYVIEGCQGISISGCGAESTTGTGNSFVVQNSTYGDTCYGISITGCWTYLSNGISFYVGTGQYGVTMTGCTEAGPDTGATYSVKTEATARCVVSVGGYVSPVSFGAATTVLNDGAGGASFPGYLGVKGNLEITGTTITDGTLLVAGNYLQFNSRDTSAVLYRASAGIIGTDGSLNIGTNLHTYGTSTLDGATTIGANLKVTGGSLVEAVSSDGLNSVKIYHTGSYGQLQSSTGFVLVSGSGYSSTVVGASDPQFRIQNNTANYNNITFYNDDLNGYIGCTDYTATAGNLNLVPDRNLVLNPGGTINCSKVIKPVQAATASAPTYVKGGIYFDTTLNKLRVGGATVWETITSS